MNTLFSNAKLLLPDGQIQSGCLGVCDQKIDFVGIKPLEFIAHREIDCQGNLLMPGFCNAHTHLPMSLLRSVADDVPLQEWLEDYIFPREIKIDGEAAYWGTQLATLELFQSGVTCVNDMYFETESMLKAAKTSGLRGLFSRGIASDPAGGGLKRLNESIDLYKNWHHSCDGRIQIGLSPHAEYTCTVDDLKLVQKAMVDLQCKLHIHVSETFFEHEQCKSRHNGLTPTALLNQLDLLTPNTVLAHCVHVEQADIALIAEKRSHILHCPQSNCKLGSGIAPVSVFMAHQINVAIGTDGVASNNDHDMIEEMRFASLLQKGILNQAAILNAAQAVAMATRAGYLALGFDGGILQNGSLADLILINLDQPHFYPQQNLLGHLVYAGKASDVMLTMINGEIVYENDEFLTLDREHIQFEATRIAEGLSD